jgi:hypothetical protein
MFVTLRARRERKNLSLVGAEENQRDAIVGTESLEKKENLSEGHF